MVAHNLHGSFEPSRLSDSRPTDDVLYSVLLKADEDDLPIVPKGTPAIGRMKKEFGAGNDVY